MLQSRTQPPGEKIARSCVYTRNSDRECEGVVRRGQKHWPVECRLSPTQLQELPAVSASFTTSALYPLVGVAPPKQGGASHVRGQAKRACSGRGRGCLRELGRELSSLSLSSYEGAVEVRISCADIDIPISIPLLVYSGDPKEYYWGRS